MPLHNNALALGIDYSNTRQMKLEASDSNPPQEPSIIGIQVSQSACYAWILAVTPCCESTFVHAVCVPSPT